MPTTTDVANIQKQAERQVLLSLGALSDVVTRHGSKASLYKIAAYQTIERIYGDVEMENAKRAVSDLVDARLDLYDALASTTNPETCRSLAIALVQIDGLYRSLLDLSVALYERDGANENTQF